VKAHLPEIADDVHRTHRRVHVTRNGRDYVVLLVAADLESLEATVELLADPATMGRIRHAEADVSAGNTASASQMNQLMAARRRRGR
jgi:prevent-host-death family protein